MHLRTRLCIRAYITQAKHIVSYTMQTAKLLQARSATRIAAAPRRFFRTAPVVNSAAKDMHPSAGVPQVKEGMKLPADKTFTVMGEGDQQPRTMTVKELFGGKKAVLFGLPGAFTSVCSSKHLPQYNAKKSELGSKGVDVIACTSVNDAYVMREWGKALGVNPEDVMLLADGDASFHQAIGLTQTLPGLGERALRYSMFLDDMEIKVLNIEEPGGMSYKVSGPDHMLQDLQRVYATAN